MTTKRDASRFGFAFKKDTGDTRETASAYVMRDLLDERASLSVYDPKVVREEMFKQFNYTLNVNNATLPGLDAMVETAPSALAAATGAHAIAIMTEWGEFAALDYSELF